MAAPASLAVSKLFYPETQQSKTTIKDIKIEKGEESNVLDAAAKVVHFKSCLIIVRERIQLLGKLCHCNKWNFDPPPPTPNNIFKKNNYHSYNLKYSRKISKIIPFYYKEKITIDIQWNSFIGFKEISFQVLK